MRSILFPLACLTITTLCSTAAARTSGGVPVVFVAEYGVGTAAQGQPYVDKLVAISAKQAGWSEASGSYQTTRAAADVWIARNSPHFGVFSLAAFLAVRDKHKLDVIGSMQPSRASGQQYHLISKTASTSAECKGKTLASNVDDAKFVDKVVLGGKMKLADFTLVATTRPAQTVKKVVSGDAVCALIDDAQYADLKNVEGAEGVKSIWQSDKLPPLVVVAFPSAPAAEKKGFQGIFPKLCEGDGKSVCGELGASAFKSSSGAEYQSVIAAYAKL